MKQEKPKILKTGGRQKGSANIITRDIRQTVRDMIDRLHDDIAKDMKSLSPRERIDLYVKLLPYVCPRAVDKSASEAQEVQQIRQKFRSVIESANIVINMEKHDGVS